MPRFNPMVVLMFAARFAPLVESGRKTTTIRPRRKRPIEVTDSLSLRRWSDGAYRSKQIVLGVGTCVHVDHIVIDIVRSRPAIIVNRVKFSSEQMREVAIRDGFSDALEMVTWFRETHGLLPFQGDLIEWQLRK